MLGTGADTESHDGRYTHQRWHPKVSSSTSSTREVVILPENLMLAATRRPPRDYQPFAFGNPFPQIDSFSTGIVGAIKNGLTQLQAILPSSRRIVDQLGPVLNFDGYPPKDSVFVQLIEFYSRVVALGVPWFEPHVAQGPDGEISLEWWKGDKKLTVYLSGSGPRFVKVWGPSVVHEMEDGEVASGDRLYEPYHWLFR